MGRNKEGDRVPVRLPGWLIAEIAERAARLGCSRAAYIRDALTKDAELQAWLESVDIGGDDE